MDYVTLGRTGLRVSVAGLGCGGFSRLGLGRGKSEAEAVALIHQALDLGVNLFDTAAAYGTEAVLGKALMTVPRDQVVIATKAPFNVSNPNSSAESAIASLDNSLRQLDGNGTAAAMDRFNQEAFEFITGPGMRAMMTAGIAATREWDGQNPITEIDAAG